MQIDPVDYVTEPPPVPPLRWGIGETLRQRTRLAVHAYTLKAVAPYMTRGGSPSAILMWEGRCAVCGQPFIIRTGRKPDRWLARTCPEHRRPSGKASANGE
jgi:hypothetical protein